MNSNWRNRPTTIDYISKSIDYVVGIDESGTSSLKKVLEAKRKGIEVPDSERTLHSHRIRHFYGTFCRSKRHGHGSEK